MAHHQMSCAASLGLQTSAPLSTNRTRKYGGKFQHGFGVFLQSSELADITISGPDGKEYRAHKLLLSYHSEFFRRLFTADFKEKGDDVIRLHFEDPAGVWPTLLEFFYTDEISLSDGTVLPLLAMARELMVKSIEEFCSEFAQSSLEASNAIQYLNQAVKFNCDSFRESCVALVAEAFPASFNKPTDGLPSEVVLEVLSHPALVVQTEEQVFTFVLNYVERHDVSTEVARKLFSQVRFPFLSNERLASLSQEDLVPKDLLLSAMAVRFALLDRPERLNALISLAPAHHTTYTSSMHTSNSSNHIHTVTNLQHKKQHAPMRAASASLTSSGNAAVCSTSARGLVSSPPQSAYSSSMDSEAAKSMALAAAGIPMHGLAGQQSTWGSMQSSSHTGHMKRTSLSGSRVTSCNGAAGQHGSMPVLNLQPPSPSLLAALPPVLSRVAPALMGVAMPALHPSVLHVEASFNHSTDGFLTTAPADDERSSSQDFSHASTDSLNFTAQSNTSLTSYHAQHAAPAAVQPPVDPMGLPPLSVLPRKTYICSIEYGLPGGSEYASVPMQDVWEDLVPQLQVRVSGDVVEGDAQSILRLHDQDTAWFNVSGDPGSTQAVWVELEFPPNMRVVELTKYTFCHGMNFANHMFPYGISDTAWVQMKGLQTHVSDAASSDSDEEGGGRWYSLQSSETSASNSQFEYAVRIEEGTGGAAAPRTPPWRRLRIYAGDEQSGATGGNVRLSLRKLRLYGRVEVSLLREGLPGSRDVLATWKRKKDAGSRGVGTRKNVSASITQHNL